MSFANGIDHDFDNRHTNASQLFFTFNPSCSKLCMAKSQVMKNLESGEPCFNIMLVLGVE